LFTDPDMRKVFSLPHDQDPEETVSASDPVAATVTMRAVDRPLIAHGGRRGTVASGWKASPTSTRVEAIPLRRLAKGLKAADRERYLERSGLQVEDTEGADR